MWLLFCICFIPIRSIDFDSGKDRNRGREFNLATALRTMVVVIMAWGMVFLTNSQEELQAYRKRAGFSLSCQA